MKSLHWRFFIINVLLTWTLWFCSILLGGLTSIIGVLFYIVGGTVPLSTALYLVYDLEGSKGLSNFFSRMTNPRLIQGKWLLLSILMVFTPVLAASMLEIGLLGTRSSILNALGFFSGFSIAATSIVFNLIAVFLEEPGWRGVALESMLREHSALLSSMIVGAVWAVWHLPLFVMPGTYQESIGLGSMGFWLYMAAIPGTSLLITWFYCNSRKSILAAMVFHLLNNLAGEIFSLTVILEGVRIVGSYTLVLLVLFYFGSRSMNRSGFAQSHG